MGGLFIRTSMSIVQLKNKICHWKIILSSLYIYIKTIFMLQHKFFVEWQPPGPSTVSVGWKCNGEIILMSMIFNEKITSLTRSDITKHCKDNEWISQSLEPFITMHQDSGITPQSLHPRAICRICRGIISANVVQNHNAGCHWPPCFYWHPIHTYWNIDKRISSMYLLIDWIYRVLEVQRA